MNRKNIPLLLMLTAGAVTCIITYIKKYPVHIQLIALFTVLLVFYVLGSVLVWTVGYFEKQNEEKRAEEGEVIEKDSENPEGAEQKDGQEE
nr:hypothetical protein [uncultured Acetatifactor sp.]